MRARKPPASRAGGDRRPRDAEECGSDARECHGKSRRLCVPDGGGGGGATAAAVAAEQQQQEQEQRSQSRQGNDAGAEMLRQQFSRAELASCREHEPPPPVKCSGQQVQPPPPQLPRWEKVLWKSQPYPDNYTDESFLQHLVVNANVPQRDFAQVALDSAAVTQQVSAVVAAVSVPVHLRLGLLRGSTLLLVDVLLLLAGYAVCGLLGGHVLGGSLRRGIRQAALLSGGVYLMSPMLHTLTRNISEDSVVAMIACLCLLHLSLHDYNFVNSVTEQLTGTLSLGAAVFASVLFAGLLPAEFDVFVHVLFCLEAYLLSPFARRYVRNASLSAHLLLTAAMAGAALALLLPLSGVLSAVFCGAVLAVSLACPYWLVRIGKFKAKINGPWDEAVPRMPTRLQQQERRRRRRRQEEREEGQMGQRGQREAGGERAAAAAVGRRRTPREAAATSAPASSGARRRRAAPAAGAEHAGGSGFG